jgi:hypothetical protein
MVNEAQGDPRQWPDPEQITTPAEFAATMHAIRAASGLSYARLSVVTGDFAYPMSKSSVHALCTKPRLPSQRLAMESFLLACGASEDQLEPWRKAWQRVQQNSAHGPAPAPTIEPDDVSDVNEPALDEFELYELSQTLNEMRDDTTPVVDVEPDREAATPPAARARHARPVLTWESFIKQLIDDPMTFAWAVALIVLAISVGIVGTAWGLHAINTMP